MLKASIIGLLILLILIIVYQYYKISEGFVNEPKPRVIAEVIANTTSKPPFIEVLANTTDSSTILDAKILYNSTIPILQSGQRTDSVLTLNTTIRPTTAQITKKMPVQMNNGHKYYIVSSNVDKYTEGVTPLLGSFVYSEPTISSTQPEQASSTAPVGNSAAVPVVPVASAAQPSATLVTPSTIPASQEAVVAKEKQEKSELLRDIQQIVRTELLGQQKITTASSQPVLRAGSNGDILMSPAAAQGQEMSTTREKLCPKDMNEYIRKDSIPCWNCSLDY